MSDLDHYINGQWVPGQGPDLVCTDPATGQTTWQGHAADQSQINQAVAAARTATQPWADTPLPQRIQHTQAFAEQLKQHKEALAQTISRDTGKPLWESLTEVGAMIGKINLSIQAYEERRSTVTHPLNNATAITRFKPHGVCAVYGPFNLPGHLPNGHIVPALIAGNTVVFKPSEQTAAVAQHMIQLWHATGLPPGVVNMVQGARDTGIQLAQHPDLNGLFFTGSSAAGKALSQSFANHPGKILALEMGGHNPLIIWDVADFQPAINPTIQSAFITAGQRCTCARRLILPDTPQGRQWTDQLAHAITHNIRIGPYTDRPEPFMGPVISNTAAKKLLATQQSLINQGSQPIVEMTPNPNCPALLSPGLIDVTPIADRPNREEPFGPLLQVIYVKDFDAAIQEANRTPYGLSAALFSDSRPLYDRFYRTVRAGVVNWNRQTTGASGQLPFGGTGDSGNHRPSGYYAADYCSFPVASIESDQLAPPDTPIPGLTP